MNQRVITIKNPKDDTMGASINSLVDVLEQWNSVSENENITLDLSRITFVHPFFILPICVLISDQGDRIEEIQSNPRINSYYLDVCIADNGLGILGSYIKVGITDVNDDAAAIKRTINGQSTKQITETRGYGIDTSRRMLVEGLMGKYLLFSGNAFYIYTSEIEQIYKLPGFGWKGTMLALQIPGRLPAGFNYTTYLE